MYQVHDVYDAFAALESCVDTAIAEAQDERDEAKAALEDAEAALSDAEDRIIQLLGELD